jgi:UDP-N-acetylmuramate dehydrogenase
MRILEDFPLSDIVYYRIGGKAKKVFEVSSVDEVRDALKICHKEHITDLLVIGIGSNIVIPDEGFCGAVIKMIGAGESFEISGKKIKAFAGETLDSLIKESLSSSLIGLEWAGGLPSSLGGAVRGNAGAFGHEAKDTFFELEAIDSTDPNLTVKVYSKPESNFSYRDSFFKNHPNLLIVSVTFELKEGSIEEVSKAEEVYKENIEYRDKHHPMEYPSCGSVFKNITEKEKVDKILAIWPDVQEISESKWHHKISMGYVINRLGFSGKKIGGAMVSHKHTNYIVNFDQAKATDVKGLITEIQNEFANTFGFVPEPEVILL